MNSLKDLQKQGFQMVVIVRAKGRLGKDEYGQLEVRLASALVIVEGGVLSEARRRNDM
jgi:hypothetical protein